MAYETGTVISPTALKTVIETFCTTNGFALTGGSGGWLSKGQTNVSLNPTIPGNILSITRVGTLATVSMSDPHGLTTGASITIRQATDPLYNGTFVVTVTSTTQFTYTMSGTPVADATGFSLNAIGTSLTTLTISAANSSDGSSGVCPHTNSIYIEVADWPVTYYLFIQTNPEQVACVLQYATSKIQVIMFGDLVKIHGSAYVGGNWFFASRGGKNLTIIPQLYGISDTVYTCCTNVSSSNSQSFTGLPFCQSTAITSYGVQNARGAHVEVDGYTWGDKLDSNPKINVTDYTLMEYFRSPNIWNSQTQLIPIHLQFEMLSSLAGYLGYIEHIRFIRVDNYEIGDIVTLGSDKWKVFPWLQKNTTYRNGVYSTIAITGASGTLGFAVRYDGP